jgi:hypothetical protein
VLNSGVAHAGMAMSRVPLGVAALLTGQGLLVRRASIRTEASSSPSFNRFADQSEAPGDGNHRGS